MTDDGAASDQQGVDWDAVAGSPPDRRSGQRELVSPDEAQTLYRGVGSDQFELLGTTVDFQTGGSQSQETIQRVTLTPHDPRRLTDLPGIGWAVHLGVDEGGYEGLFEDGPVDEPLPEYEPETTGDYRAVAPESLRGDGSYERDAAEVPLTAQIADVVTRNGGRIPTEFSATVQDEGYARSRRWTVYAPESNPFHIAAAVTDLLRDVDDLSEINVSVTEESAAETSSYLRETGVGWVFDQKTEADLIKRFLREMRWRSGLPRAYKRALKSAPTRARRRFEAAELDFDSQYIKMLRRLVDHPGDAWEYQEITIQVSEEAQNPYYG